MLTALEVYAPLVNGIPMRIEAEFLKKARGKIQAECSVEHLLLRKVNGKGKTFKVLDKEEGQDAQVPILTELRDSKGDLVAKVTVIWSFRESSKRK